jgi:deoxyribodipyrimidine photolyase
MYGEAVDCTQRFCQEHQINALFRNRSYGQGSQTRDQKLIEWARESGIAVHNYSDYLIVEPTEIPVRKIFSPFATLWKKLLLGFSHPDALVRSDYRQYYDGLFVINSPSALPS